LYRKVCKKAGVKHTSHDLRHTFAAYFLEEGNSTELLSKALGHSDIEITQRYYSHFTKKRQIALDEANERTQAAMASGD
jgi:integrase